MVPRIIFYKVVRGATPPMAADKSALGSMPMAPYTYCEAMRTASGYGWYAFPLEDLIVRFDGHSVEVWDGDSWDEVDGIELNDEDAEAYRQQAGCDPPPVYTKLFVPGYIQLWTGLLVATASDWSVQVGPIANVRHHRGYETKKGIIETDFFKPCPLFINCEVVALNQDILFSKSKPLFQVQALPRVAYAGERPAVVEEMTPDLWAGVAQTTRPFDSNRPPGEYAKAVRKRSTP